jgi:N-acyl-D-aspartate/D-glutamate deacylase
MSRDFDLVIRSGTVVDGSGSAPVQADVAVVGDRIVQVGSVTGSGREEIDASDRIVTPGFVDVHTHYDGQITWEQRLAPSSGHGVTSVVMGNCGVGFAPAREEHRQALITLMEGVEDIPEVVMAAGVPWNWETFPEYLDALEQRRSDIDFAAQVPHSPLRVYVMGMRGAELEPPTEADLAQMRRLVREAVEAGAVGVSTSRSLAHRTKAGQLAPSVRTEDREALALAEGLRDAGSGVFQIIPDTSQAPQEQFALIREIARRSGRPTSFSFMQMPDQPDGWRVLLRGLEEAQQEGLTIRGQIIPRPTGALLGLDLSLHPFSLHPSYQPIADLPLPQRVAAMRDPELRRRLVAERPENPNPFLRWVVKDREQLYVLGDPPNYHQTRDESIAARARAAGRDPVEVIYDALLQRDGREILFRPMANLTGERMDGAGLDLLGSDRTVLGLGDGGAHYGMVCDATYPTYLLTYWVRDADPEWRVELPQAVRMLTRDTAETVGLLDRGRIGVGYKADLNVIDVDRLHLHAPTVTYDLPQRGRRLVQKAEGYDATIVSGVVTYRDGVATGSLPGRLIRGAQPSPA